jgi:hypothetical protein
VQVLEHQDDRLLVGEALEEAAPGGEALALRHVVGHADPEQAPHPRRHPAGLALVDGNRAHGLLELGRRLALRVGLHDPRLRLHDLGQRPEADALAVGQRAALAPRREVGLRVHALEELVDEPRLADPGHADERHELQLPLRARPLERVAQLVELALPPDQRRFGP